MSVESIKKFEAICSLIIRNIPSDYTWKWKWDEEFSTALIVFDQKDADAVFSTISSGFDRHWDFSTLEESEDHIKSFLNSAFGMVPGQRIFAAEDPSGEVLLAAWWPWGNGEKISLRIGIFSPEAEIVITDENKERLMKWFAI